MKWNTYGYIWKHPSPLYAYHLHHLWVVEVVDDVLEDIAVRHEAERAEHDDDGDLLLDVRQDRDDPLADGGLLHVLWRGEHGDDEHDDEEEKEDDDCEEQKECTEHGFSLKGDLQTPESFPYLTTKLVAVELVELSLKSD